MARQADIIYRDNLIMAMVNSKFIPGNEGHVIIVPTRHFENIFDLPLEYAHRISDFARHIAAALKHSYQCDGVMLQQNNGPASGQHAFHYHLHVFPRFTNDNFSSKTAYVAEPSARIPFVVKLKDYLSRHPFTSG